MNTFRKTAPVKSVMFAVNYDDGRTAYLWVNNRVEASGAAVIASTARVQQEQGSLPKGTIISIKRVR